MICVIWLCYIFPLVRVDDFQGLFKYIFSLVCGHQKSTNFTNALAIQAGVHKKEKISHIDYRSALPEGNAHDYQTTFVNSSGLTKKTAPNKSLYAENWAFGLACQKCAPIAMMLQVRTLI